MVAPVGDVGPRVRRVKTYGGPVSELAIHGIGPSVRSIECPTPLAMTIVGPGDAKTVVGHYRYDPNAGPPQEDDRGRYVWEPATRERST